MSQANLPKAGIYRHYKGNEYQVLDVAVHSEDESLYVVYKPLYGETSAQRLWIRPLKMFMEMVKLDGHDVPRFEYIRHA